MSEDTKVQSKEEAVEMMRIMHKAGVDPKITAKVMAEVHGGSAGDIMLDEILKNTKEGLSPSLLKSEEACSIAVAFMMSLAEGISIVKGQPEDTQDELIMSMTLGLLASSLQNLDEVMCNG